MFFCPHSLADVLPRMYAAIPSKGAGRHPVGTELQRSPYGISSVVLQ